MKKFDLSNIRLIGFDVDNTLTKTKSSNTFRKTADDWELLPGRMEQVRDLRDQAFSLFLASNQGGVAYGYFEEESITGELHRLARMLSIPSQAVHICFSHPKATIERYRVASDERRKPNAGMIIEAMTAYNATADTTLFVGDRPEDEQAARNAGCRFVWAEDFFEEKKQPSLDQLRQDALSVLATEKAAIITGREAIDASKKRRAEISALLNTMHEEYRQIFEQLHGLPDLPQEKYLNWADNVLSLKNLAIVVLDTTGVEDDSDIIRVYAANQQGCFLDTVINPQRQRTANTAWTGLELEQLEKCPTIEKAWPHVRHMLEGCYFISFNLDFIEARLNDNIQHYGLARLPHMGTCLMRQAKSYFDTGYGYGSGLKLPDAVARIGKPMPYSPPSAADRATACMELLKAMSNGITSAPAPATQDDELDHPF